MGGVYKRVEVFTEAGSTNDRTYPPTFFSKPLAGVKSDVGKERFNLCFQ